MEPGTKGRAGPHLPLRLLRTGPQLLIGGPKTPASTAGAWRGVDDQEERARSVARMFLRGSRELNCHCVAQSRCQIITADDILRTASSCNGRQIHTFVGIPTSLEFFSLTPD